MDNSVQDEIIAKVILDLGEMKGILSQIPVQYERLDKRINGTFTEINEHIRSSSDWRSRTIVLEMAVKTLGENILDNMSKTKEKFESIKEEKLNSTKASQWRIAIIVSLIMGVLSNIDKIINFLSVFIHN